MNFSDDFAHFYLHNGILQCIYKPNTYIDLNAAKSVVRSRLHFQAGVAYPILCDIRQLKIADKPARDYLAEKGCLLALAVALVIDEDYLGTLTKAFIHLSNPAVPTKEFTSIPEALHFLENYKN